MCVCTRACEVGRALRFPPAFCVAGQTSQWAEEGAQSSVLGLGVYEPGLLTLVLGMSGSLGSEVVRMPGTLGCRAGSLQELSACPAVGLVWAALMCALSAWGSSPPSCCLAAPLPEPLWLV